MSENFFSSFNIHDIFTRLLPGVLYVTFIIIMLNESYYYLFLPLNNIKVWIFLGLSYIVGTAFRFPSKGTTYIIHKMVYGGNPREIYAYETKSEKRSFPIKEEKLRRIAKACSDDIIKKAVKKLSIMSEDFGKSDSHIIYSNDDYRFALGIMITNIELAGQANREERMSVLSNMCINMCTTLLIILLSLPFFILSPLGRDLDKLVLSCGIVIIIIGVISFGYLFVRYERTRYSSIVRMYYALLNKEAVSAKGYRKV